MHDEIEFMPLQPANGAGGDGADLRRLHDVPVELAVEIGRTRMTIGQTLELRPGSVVSLNRLAGEPVDLLINGKPIARGEVVVIDEEFGLRVTDVVSTGRTLEDEAETAEAAAAAAAQAEADLLASMAGAQESQPLPDPFSEASVDDLPMGGLPTPGIVD
ncbi:MAG: flagellar motor switch protein FliN [Thermoleophilaceae bacterium]|nr:flagellar motor switch protein FliN [Thermoleophilaceae bacterium]